MLNVIIEPQSSSEDLVAYAIHLNYLIEKMKTRRRGQKDIKNNISLIKLHPTLV
jgi:hypothetical protein